MVTTLFILAGGASSRFGSSKPRHRYQDKALASWVAECALEAGLEPVLLVKDSSLSDLGWPLFLESSSEGHYPLRAMLEVLQSLSEEESVLFCPCDLPFLKPSSLLSLASHPAPCVAWDGARLHPLLCQLSTAQAPELEQWVQNQGSARGFLANARRVRVSEAELRNINRPEDLVSV